eukprot:scaffold905_cov363-Pavlova_lutheri.AAC.4
MGFPVLAVQNPQVISTCGSYSCTNTGATASCIAPHTCHSEEYVPQKLKSCGMQPTTGRIQLPRYM